MSKIICDVCGTSYPDTAEQCPICGCSRDSAADLLEDELLMDDFDSPKAKGGRAPSRKKKEIFDFDEVNSGPRREPEDEDDSLFDEEEEETYQSNTFVVILLTVLIAALLLAAGFLFFRYFLPNMNQQEPEATTLPQFMQTTAATDSTAIPCENLVMTSEREAVLNEVGARFLLHVIPKPGDTTDALVFTSADESIATVTDDGRIEAVAEGETVVTITCGEQKIEVPVKVSFEEPTEAPTTAATEAPDAEETTPATTAETVAQGQGDSGQKDVTLKLKRTDIMLGVYYEFQLLLDCDLEQNEVEWSSEHPHIATVDEEGWVKAIKAGTTSITAKYGDQEVSCIVRCG